MLLNAPRFSHKKFGFLLSRWLAGRFTQKEDRVGIRRDVDADRILREVCGGALVATIHSGNRSTDEAGADVTTPVTGAFTVTAFRAAADLIISPPDAVLRAALEVPTTFPAQTPATVVR